MVHFLCCGDIQLEALHWFSALDWRTRVLRRDGAYIKTLLVFEVVFTGQTNYNNVLKLPFVCKVLYGSLVHHYQHSPHFSTLSHLKYVNENVLLWLLGAANILQNDGVVDALGVRLVQVICVWLVPLLEGEEDLVLIRTHYLNILERYGGRREEEKGGVKREQSYFLNFLILLNRPQICPQCMVLPPQITFRPTWLLW